MDPGIKQGLVTTSVQIANEAQSIVARILQEEQLNDLETYRTAVCIFNAASNAFSVAGAPSNWSMEFSNGTLEITEDTPAHCWTVKRGFQGNDAESMQYIVRENSPAQPELYLANSPTNHENDPTFIEIGYAISDDDVFTGVIIVDIKKKSSRSPHTSSQIIQNIAKTTKAVFSECSNLNKQIAIFNTYCKSLRQYNRTKWKDLRNLLRASQNKITESLLQVLQNHLGAEGLAYFESSLIDPDKFTLVASTINSPKPKGYTYYFDQEKQADPNPNLIPSTYTDKLEKYAAWVRNKADNRYRGDAPLGFLSVYKKESITNEDKKWISKSLDLFAEVAKKEQTKRLRSTELRLLRMISNLTTKNYRPTEKAFLSTVLRLIKKSVDCESVAIAELERVPIEPDSVQTKILPKLLCGRCFLGETSQQRKKGIDWNPIEWEDAEKTFVEPFLQCNEKDRFQRQRKTIFFNRVLNRMGVEILCMPLYLKSNAKYILLIRRHVNHTLKTPPSLPSEEVERHLHRMLNLATRVAAKLRERDIRRVLQFHHRTYERYHRSPIKQIGFSSENGSKQNFVLNKMKLQIIATQFEAGLWRLLNIKKKYCCVICKPREASGLKEDELYLSDRFDSNVVKLPEEGRKLFEELLGTDDLAYAYKKNNLLPYGRLRSFEDGGVLYLFIRAELFDVILCVGMKEGLSNSRFFFSKALKLRKSLSEILSRNRDVYDLSRDAAQTELGLLKAQYAHDSIKPIGEALMISRLDEECANCSKISSILSEVVTLHDNLLTECELGYTPVSRSRSIGTSINECAKELKNSRFRTLEIIENTRKLRTTISRAGVTKVLRQVLQNALARSADRSISLVVNECSLTIGDEQHKLAVATVSNDVCENSKSTGYGMGYFIASCSAPGKIFFLEHQKVDDKYRVSIIFPLAEGS